MDYHMSMQRDHAEASVPQFAQTFTDHRSYQNDPGSLQGPPLMADLRQTAAGELGAPRGGRSKTDSPEHPEVTSGSAAPGIQGIQGAPQSIEPVNVPHVPRVPENVPPVPGVIETDFVPEMAHSSDDQDGDHAEQSLELDDILDSKKGSKTSDSRPNTAENGWEKSVVRILGLLEEHSKFKKTAFRSRRRFFNNLFLSARLGMWMVILSGPVIVWPVAQYFNDFGDRSSKYMASYGMAMSNFCFLLSPNVGMGIRYALEGVIGTLLALANMLMLNQAFGTFMHGGAYATREEFTDTAANMVIYRSEWLPLCNLGNGARFITTNSTSEFMQQCFLNVHWSSMTDGGVRSAIVLVDLALFTALFLGFGFGASTRIYALTYLTFWLMLFVNPGSDAYMENPSDPWTQSIMTCIGCMLAVVGQFLPCPNTALGNATKLGRELTQSVAAILESLPFAPRHETRVPLESALEAPQLWLNDLGQLCGAAWFEDLGILPGRARRRHRLEQYVELQAALLQHMTLASRLGAALTDEELTKLEEKLPALVDVCAYAARALPAPEAKVDPDVLEDLDRAIKDLEREFSAAVGKFSLTGPILSFTLAVISIASGAVERVKVLEKSLPPAESGLCRVCRWFSELFRRLELPQTRSNPSHKLFVFRSTLAMVLAFLFGWVGLERAMVAYSFGAVVTVSVVVANTGQAGFSLGLIMTRLNSAVIGTVIGQAVQQVLAVQTVFHATLFGIFIWCYSVFLIFQILHSPDHASTALPVLAIGIGGLVPGNGVFRVYNAQIEPSAEIALAASVKSAVFGGGIMLLIDLFLYSSARGICQNQLRKAFQKSEGLLLRVMGLRASTSAANADGSSNEETRVLMHLDQVANLLPMAKKEPAPRGIEFPMLLFSTLEQSLRIIAIELGTLEWMLEVSSNTALVGQEELGPLLTEIEGYLSKMMSSSLVMFDDICKRKFLSAAAAGDLISEASSLRRDILDKEYTRISTTNAKIETPKAQTRRLSNLAQVAARRNSTSGTTHNFQNLIQQIREKAKENRGLLPTSDLYAQVELLVSVLATVSRHAQTIQITLAQYG